jgi:hypothetical protein
MTGSEFRNRLLAVHPKPEAVLLLAYTVARLELRKQRLSVPPDDAFAGILDLNTLFDIVLVIDSSIQARANVGWQFFKLARHLSDRAGLDLSQGRLEFINAESKKPANFANVVCSLLDRTCPTPDGGHLSPLAIAFCIRNHAAHNIASQSLVPTRTEQLLQSLFDVLFLTAEHLY